MQVMNIRVLDKLLNVGPCKKVTAGCPSISSYFQETPRRDPLFDLVVFDFLSKQIIISNGNKFVDLFQLLVCLSVSND